MLRSSLLLLARIQLSKLFERESKLQMTLLVLRLNLLCGLFSRPGATGMGLLAEQDIKAGAQSSTLSCVWAEYRRW
jgi:hypothetical protein